MNSNLVPFICLFTVGISLFIIAALLIKNEKTKNVLNRYIKREKRKENFIDKWLNSKEFIEKFEKKNEKNLYLVQDKMTPRGFTKILIYTISGGLLFSILIRNIIVVPIIILICFYFPHLYISLIVTKKRKKIEEQFGTAIKFFNTEFITNKSIIIAVQNIIPKLQNPIKGEFEKLARELNSGFSPETALINFSKRLDNKFAYIFCNLLMSYFKNGTSFDKYLLALTEDIDEDILQQKEGKTELSMVRATNLLLNSVVLVSILVLFIFIPNRAEVFKNTAQGQTLMAIVILISFLSLYLGFKLEKK